MYIINKTSASLYQPVHVAAYVGCISKSQKTILHPGINDHLTQLEGSMNKKDFLQESNKVRSNPQSYVQAMLYEVEIIYAPQDLSQPLKNFIPVSCDKGLCAEPALLEQLWSMGKQQNDILFQVTGFVDAMGYEKRISSSRGYGYFVISNFQITNQHKKLSDFRV